MRIVMRTFYYLLYHPFANTYDLVASFVSFGKWKDWVLSVIPFIEGDRVLELGHGPGHLQRVLLTRGLFAVAIDESASMGRLAKRRLGASAKLTRGLAQNLPFENESFDSIVSTFPTDYIFDPLTLSDARRVLRNGGKLIVLPGTWPKSRFLQWLYKITGQNSAALEDILKKRFVEPFQQAGFQSEMRIIELTSSTLLVIIAQKMERTNEQ